VVPPKSASAARSALGRHEETAPRGESGLEPARLGRRQCLISLRASTLTPASSTIEHLPEATQLTLSAVRSHRTRSSPVLDFPPHGRDQRRLAIGSFSDSRRAGIEAATAMRESASGL